jgi:hypothetical protein
MKYLKLFENFINDDNNLEKKLSEIRDSLPVGVDFSWKMQSEKVNDFEQGYLYISLYKNELELNLQWSIDLDNTQIQFIAEGTDEYGENVSDKSYRQKVDNIDEALDLVKQNIDECLGMNITNEKIELFLEKNVAKDQSLWASCKAWAKERYDVWPSAYACGAAAKRYKAKGGKWRKAKKRKSKKRRSRKNKRR